MAVLYMVRHGDIASRGRFIGQTDVPLSPLGHEQAVKLANLLAGVRFDCCLCSPMQRALETARHILGANDFWGKAPMVEEWLPAHGTNDIGEETAKSGTTGEHILAAGASSPYERFFPCEVTPGFGSAKEQKGMAIIPELMEISLGLWEGMTKEEVMAVYPVLWEERGLSPALVAPPHGENYPMLQKRLRPVFSLLTRLEPQKNILVVAHRSINQVLMGKFSLFPLEGWPKLVMPYGSVTLCPFRQTGLHDESV